MQSPGRRRAHSYFAGQRARLWNLVEPLVAFPVCAVHHFIVSHHWKFMSRNSTRLLYQQGLPFSAYSLANQWLGGAIVSETVSG